MKTFNLSRFKELYSIHPAELVKELFENTRNNILYIKGISMNTDDHSRCIYRCKMNWCADDCSLTISELSEMRPEAEPDGFFSDEIRHRAEKLRKLIEIEAPSVIVRNEANLLLIATVLNRFSVNVEKVII